MDVQGITASTSCYEKALFINPNEPRAKANLLNIYKQKGEFKIAHKLIDSLHEEDYQQRTYSRLLQIY